MSFGLPFYLLIEMNHAKKTAADCLSVSFSNPKENTAEINANGIHWPVEKLFFKSPLVGPEWDEGVFIGIFH